ncbi:MAG: HAMP domain-containing histidine kinase, partial [Bacteroidetes bacterium]|nr:HAMP domain-containing histidine kinase [Bacteroidota bacterium]
MTLAETLRRTWSRFFASVAYERDPGFRDVILRLCRRGMLVTGVLSIVCSLANVGAYVIAGNSVVVVPDDPETTIFLWDRLIIMVLGVVYLVLGRTQSGPQWGRLVGAVFVLVIGVAVLVDDIVQGGPEYYSDRYLGLIMLLVIALIPYQPRQALAFVFGIWGVYLVSYWYLPVLIGVEGRVLIPGVLIYILIVMFVCVGLSALLYNSRYEQYRARRSAEQLKEQVEEQAEKLVEMEQLKSRFFANISHEFRTPLTLILGPVDDALDEAYGPLSGTLRRQLYVMRRSGRRLQRLINQLLDLSKLEAGRVTLRLRQRDLISFLRGIVGSFSSLAERKHVTLQFYTEKEPLPLSFDADKLEKVVINLLSNAFKFTPEQGAIRVVVREGAGEAGAFAEICVRDTGPGIPPEERPYVFDRFHQVEQAMAQEHAGTGIGLALAKELVELHGGEIRVES